MLANYHKIFNDEVVKARKLIGEGRFSFAENEKKMKKLYESESWSLLSYHRFLIEPTREGYKPTDTQSPTDVFDYKPLIGGFAHSLKGEFLHIGNALNQIKDFIKDVPEIKEECEIIERSTSYGQILMRKLLDFLDLGKPIKEKVNMVDILLKTEALLRPRLSSNINLNVNIENKKRKVFVEANSEQLMAVLLELVENASRALRQTGGTIEISLKYKKLKDKENIHITISDDGPGITDDLKKELFVKPVKSRSGLGIGLYLCTKIITILGGSLELMSSPGKGTVVTITF
jgi:signal transduction histidine kinase